MNARPLLSCALALAVFGCAGLGGSRDSGYATDAGTAVLKSGYNLCWRTSFWTPALASADCDPDLTVKPKPAAAPTPQPASPPIAAPRPERAPATPAPAPAPKAAAAAPAAPPKPKRCDVVVTLHSDQTFGFDSSTLAPAARTRIDREVLARLQDCASIDALQIIGHTDRVGSQQYNQKLSERRAEVVKQYLVSKSVPSAKITALGKGKTAPVKFCPDSRTQRETIACLAANRRVEIEIKGPGK